MNHNSNRGFTLVEIVVVITIIGLLAAIGGIGYQRTLQNSRASTAKADLDTIKDALTLLEVHTNELPRHNDPSSCIHNDEATINNCNAGLRCNDGNFPNWKGPYLEENFFDPWGNQYIFDPDYGCNAAWDGCEGVTGTVRVVYSPGPNGVGGYEADNIVLLLCQ